MTQIDFSDEELFLLSEGILVLMRDAREALKLVRNAGSHQEIDFYISDLQELNRKIRNMMEP